MKKALEIASGLIQEFKLKELAADKLTNLIEAQLGASLPKAPATKPASAAEGPVAEPKPAQATDTENPK
jgi:hypothetical protein